MAKTAIVTGASRGIGREIAKRLTADTWHLEDWLGMLNYIGVWPPHSTSASAEEK